MRQLAPEQPLQLQQIITKALEKDRERRYQSGIELKTDLECLRQENRQVARPVTRFLNRRRVALGTLAVVVAVVASLSVSLRRSKSVPFATTKTTRLTGDGQTFKATISPDGRYIAHTSLVAGQESLRVRRATTLNDIEIVPPQAVRYIGITFSPDSETIYYVVRTEKTDPPSLYRVAVMGGSPEKLKARLDSPVTLSPNGKKFAFVRESESESSLIVADLEAGASRASSPANFQGCWIIRHGRPTGRSSPAPTPIPRSPAPEEATRESSRFMLQTGPRKRCRPMRGATSGNWPGSGTDVGW